MHSRPFLTALAAVSTFAALASSAKAGPDFLFAFTEDAPKRYGAEAVEPARRLGAKAFRITLMWEPGQAQPNGEQAAALDRVTSASRGMRIVLSVYADRPAKTPLDDAARGSYCGYVKHVLERYPAFRDVVIWNEPNKTFFWRPQFNPDGSSAAPAAYGALLARCYDMLRAVRPRVNVIAPATAPRGNDDPDAVSNISHSPATFIRELGKAYRTSGRSAPIFDTVGHHIHGNHSAERPWKQHAGAIAQNDLDKLVEALVAGFGGTPQPLPGQCVAYRCVYIWYLEGGYQTEVVPAKQRHYTGRELDPKTVADFKGGERSQPPAAVESSAPDQWTQIFDGVRRAYCQPYVQAFFNFLLWDEPALGGWQSAPFWADRTPKNSYPAFQRVIREANERKVDCTKLKDYRPYRDVVLQDRPHAYWRLGDSGSAARDEVGSSPGAYGGAVPGAPGALAAESDASASFDGLDDEVDLGSRFDAAGATPFSVEAWIRPASTPPLGAQAHLVSKEQEIPRREGWALGRNGGFLTFSRHQSGAEDTIVFPVALPTTSWTYVAGTFDGSVMRLYVNAIEKGTLASAKSVQAHGGALKLGRRSDGSLPFAGQLDEVALYPLALPKERILEHFTNGLRRAPFRAESVPPDSPRGLKARLRSRTVELSWSDNRESDVRGYYVYRSRPGGRPTRISSVPVVGRRFTDSRVRRFQSYVYTLRAIDTADNLSRPSAGASARTR